MSSDEAISIDSEVGKDALTFKKVYPKYTSIETEFIKYLHVAFREFIFRS